VHAPFAAPQELAQVAHGLQAEVDEHAVHLALGGLCRHEVQNQFELVPQRLRLVGGRQALQAERPLHAPVFGRQAK
jgi:hypothetical protein